MKEPISDLLNEILENFYLEDLEAIINDPDLKIEDLTDKKIIEKLRKDLGE